MDLNSNAFFFFVQGALATCLVAIFKKTTLKKTFDYHEPSPLPPSSPPPQNSHTCHKPSVPSGASDKIWANLDKHNSL